MTVTVRRTHRVVDDVRHSEHLRQLLPLHDGQPEQHHQEGQRPQVEPPEGLVPQPLHVLVVEGVQVVLVEVLLRVRRAVDPLPCMQS